MPFSFDKRAIYGALLCIGTFILIQALMVFGGPKRISGGSSKSRFTKIKAQLQKETNKTAWDDILEQFQEQNDEMDPEINAFDQMIMAMHNQLSTEKAQAIKEAMKFAWDKYKQYAWGSDELNPSKRNGKNWMNLGLTILDSIDTLWIMGLKDEYKEAREFISKLDFEVDQSASVFEMNIRILGGLLSTYSLTSDPMFLKQAKNLADILLYAWERSGFLLGRNSYPAPLINLKTKETSWFHWSVSEVTLAEMGTLQLEFCTLSYFTKDHKYCKKTLKLMTEVLRMAKNGAVRQYLHLKDGHIDADMGEYGLGSLSDSYYEYLLKMWLITDKKVDKYGNIYDQAVKGMVDKIIIEQFGYVYPKNGKDVNKLEHLACFAGGMFALGASHRNSSNEMKLGADITYTCRKAYISTKSQLGAEISLVVAKNEIIVGKPFYVLRPETIESYFYMWRLSGDPKYRQWGWEAFIAMNITCRSENGFHGLNDVNNVNSARDPQESFFMSETLKYLYLLFTNDSVIDLNEWVFNTEAHPLPIWKDDPKEWMSMFDEFNRDVATINKQLPK